MHAVLRELGVEARRAVRAARILVRGLELRGEHEVLLGARRERPVDGGIEAARRDFEETTHGSNAMHGLVRPHEPERFGGVRFDSWTDQAANFFRISRSSRSTLFSRRSCASSARSSVVSPSLRLPSSRSACLTQFAMVCADGAKSFARLAVERPARTSSIMRRRNSGEYGGGGGGFFGIGHSSVWVSTEPGQLQEDSESGSKH